MEFERVAEALANIKMTGPRKGRVLYDAVIDKRPERILELGFHQGVSTCYLAAALDELGRGHILTMDRQAARSQTPSIFDHLGMLGLEKYVTPVFAQRTFTWELAKLVRDGVEEPFDFVFHDGGHNWDTAGYAFFLTDTLCSPGAWMLFDDLEWTHESPSMAETGWVKAMSDDERRAAHVGMVYELLVKRHPAYGEFSLTYGGRMGWTRKLHEVESPTGGAPAVPARSQVSDFVSGAKRRAWRAGRRLRRRLKL